MKKSISHLFFTFFILLSCAKNQTDVPIFSYSLSNNKIEKLTLNSLHHKEIIAFNYLHPTDTVKNVDLRYFLEKDILMINLDTFLPTKKMYNSKSLDFKIYQTTSNITKQRSLVFHKDYGLLANLALGEDYLFLKDSLSETENKAIFKEIFLELNKITIK